MVKTWGAVLLFSVVLAGPASAQAGEMLVLHLDPARSTLDFVLDATLHTVRGNLGRPSGRIAFDPSTGWATGQVVIDLARADTGIDRRDQKMHDKVLETDRYPEAVYTIDRIDLPAALQQGRNDVQLHGVLELQGETHEVAVPAVARVEGDQVTATGWIDVPYVDWGLPDPSFFVLRVGKTVRVELEIGGALEGKLPPAPATAAAPQPR